LLTTGGEKYREKKRKEKREAPLLQPREGGNPSRRTTVEKVSYFLSEIATDFDRALLKYSP